MYVHAAAGDGHGRMVGALAVGPGQAEATDHAAVFPLLLSRGTMFFV